MKTTVRGVLVISAATVLEAVRNRLLLVSLAFAVVLVGLSVAAASVSLWERSRLIVDVGLAAASGLGSIIAIALTISSFAGELRKHTTYVVLVRPIPRWAFVLGKYLGVLATMQLVVALMILATAITVQFYGELVSASFWACLWLTWIEMAVVCAISLMFSTLTGPVLATTYAVGVILAGNLANDLITMAAKATAEQNTTATAILEILYYVLPDLETLSLRAQAANAMPIPDGFLGTATVYGTAYAVAVLTIAMLIFSRRRTV